MALAELEDTPLPPLDEDIVALSLSTINIGDQVDLSDEVEEVLADLLMKQEAVDQSDFSVVQYINEMFPSEQSLSNMDEVMSRMERRIEELDDETRQVIRGQGTAQDRAQEVVEEATHMIQTLFAKIREVQDRATRSEEMVRDITRDIQQLDQAKKNLTWSITTLNNLTLLIEAIDKLKLILHMHTDDSTGALVPMPNPPPHAVLPYSEIVDRLSQASHVLNHVMCRYISIPVIGQLAQDCKTIKLELSARISKDFRDMLTGPSARNLQSNAACLQSACHVIDLLDPRVKAELIDWFLRLQLSEYGVLFEQNESTAWLDKIDHRYTWLRTCLTQVDKKFTSVFPKSWSILERLVVEFCRVTRESLSQIMSQRRAEMTHNLLVFAIQRTHAFESNLAHSFTGDTILNQSSGEATPATEAVGQQDLQPDNPFFVEALAETDTTLPNPPNKEKDLVSPFTGIISICFEDHMHLYIANVDKLLSEQLSNRLLGDLSVNQSSVPDFGPVLNRSSGVDGSAAGESLSGQGGAPVDNSDPAENTLNSATDLFLMYKKILKQSLQLSRRGALVELSRVLGKYLREYANQVLTGHLPVKKIGGAGTTATHIINSILREEQMVKLSKEDMIRVCVILVTGSYCLKTAEELERKLKGEVDPELSGQISFSSEMDLLGQCRSSCVQLLASDLELACDPPLNAMSKMPWATVDTVGDQSNYVTAIVNHFRTNVPVVRDTLHNVRAYFTQFCIKFANAFIAKFITTLFKCRPVGTVGAEQLLLDTHSLKTALVDMPIIGTKFHPPPPRSFTNLVLQGMGKAEMIMKAVMTPADKHNAFIDSYRQLLPDSDLTEFQKILEMKGLRRQEQNILSDLFRERRGQEQQGSSSAGGSAASGSESAESSRIKKLEKIIKKRL